MLLLLSTTQKTTTFKQHIALSAYKLTNNIIYLGKIAEYHLIRNFPLTVLAQLDIHHMRCDKAAISSSALKFSLLRIVVHRHGYGKNCAVWEKVSASIMRKDGGRKIKNNSS